jgi:hypothetical protein
MEKSQSFPVYCDNFISTMYVHTEWSVNLTINYEELGAKFFTQKKQCLESVSV